MFQLQMVSNHLIITIIIMRIVWSSLMFILPLAVFISTLKLLDFSLILTQNSIFSLKMLFCASLMLLSAGRPLLLCLLYVQGIQLL